MRSRELATFDVSGAPVDVVVVVVTFRSEPTVDRLLESLHRSVGGLRIAVVVVDNASDDATTDVVGRHDDVLLVEAGGNIGYGAGINLGSTAAPASDITVVLNPDLAAEPGMLAELIDELGAGEGHGVAVPALRNPDDSLACSIRREPTVLRTLGDALLGARWRGRPSRLGEIVYADETYRDGGDVDWATGAAFGISGRCAKDVGPWDERFFLYSEEVDFARRARTRGWRVRYVPSAVAVHDGGGSGSSPVLDALLAINRVHYMRRYHGRPAAAVTWAALLLGQILRSRRPGAGTRLSLIARPWSWARLVPDRLGGCVPVAEPMRARR